MDQLCDYLNKLLTKYNSSSNQDEHEPKRFEPSDGEEFMTINAVNSLLLTSSWHTLFGKKNCLILIIKLFLMIFIKN
jgi:hypothetical protein